MSTNEIASTCPVHRPQIDIVIVNWNAGAFLSRLISSIEQHGGTDVASVIVVDNGSTDGSQDIQSDSLPLDVVMAGANLGFGRACNLGAKRGSAPYILFLNPDTMLLSDTLRTVLSQMEREALSRVGVCGIRLIGKDGGVQRHSAHIPKTASMIWAATGMSALFPSRFPGLHNTGFDHLSTRTVDHVIGAFYLIRRKVFEELSGFDERFFVYLEDLDLSARVWSSGHEILYFADAAALHYGGGTSEQIKPQRLAYSLESRIIYSFKHFSVFSAALVLLATMLIEPFPRLFRAGLRRSPEEALETLKGYALLWRRLSERLIGSQKLVSRTSTASTYGGRNSDESK